MGPYHFKLSIYPLNNYLSQNCLVIALELLQGRIEQEKPGLIELADTGTLFLDEIAEIPLNLLG